MVNSEVRIAISKLKSLDLKTTSFFDVKNAITTIQNNHILAIDFPIGQFIVRGRPDTDPANVFKEPKEISYIADSTKIAHFNRASRPGVPIFYGSIPDDKPGPSVEENCFILCQWETSKLLNATVHRPSHEHHFEYNTMGKWRVKKPLRVAIIAHKRDFQEQNPTLKQLNKFYEDEIKSKSNCDDILYVAEFLSNEFGKTVEPTKGYEYKISAAYSEHLFDQGLDGIIYPSVKGTAFGFNIALSRSAVDEKHIMFDKAIIWKTEFRGMNVVRVPWLFCDKLNKFGKFEWVGTGSYQSKANISWNKLEI
jgi:hypothetical protein